MDRSPLIAPDYLEALAACAGQPAHPSALQRLAGRYGEPAARWAIGQWELRARAAAKFAHAQEMLFDRDGLEMATHEAVAAWRAARFPHGVRVADLTCGIGADLIALARRGPAVGYDIDPARAELARWNLEASGAEAEVVAGDGVEALPQFEYAFADPSRRVEGRRVRGLGEFQPDPRPLAARMAALRLGAIKLSPLLPDDALEGLGPGLEFVSFGWECREALVWTGRDAAVGRWAVRVETNERLEAGEPPELGELGTHLYEADPAAIRAHALGTLGSQLGLQALGDSNGYLTGPSVRSPWLRAFRVLLELPTDLKRARQALRERGWGVAAVKSRYPGVEPARLQRELGASGEPVTVVAWPEGRSRRIAAIVREDP